MKNLESLSTGGAALPTTLEAAAGGRRLVCELVALDRLGCSFDRLALISDELAGASMERLKKISEKLVTRITYLLEPLAPIELDEDSAVVQLRSHPPHREEDRRTYYELHVRRGGEIALCRYEKQNGSSRRRVPAHVTREVLSRLAADLAAALDHVE